MHFYIAQFNNFSYELTILKLISFH